MWTTGVGQAEHFGCLVKGFTCGIVKRFTQQPVLANTIDAHQLGVPPGDQQSDKRVLRMLVLQHGGQQVPFHMMHTQRRDVPGPGQCLGQGGTHHQGPHQPGACRVGNAIQFLGGSCRVLHDLVHKRQRLAHVITRRQLRHHATVLDMDIHLAEQGVRQQPTPGIEDGHAGFVAGGLEAQNSHCRSLFLAGCDNNGLPARARGALHPAWPAGWQPGALPGRPKPASPGFANTVTWV